MTQCVWACMNTRCTAWSISSVVTPGFTIMAAMSRTSRASCQQTNTGVSKPKTASRKWHDRAGPCPHLAHHSHAFDVLGREDLDLRRPLQELLGLRHPCGEGTRTGSWHQSHVNTGWHWGARSVRTLEKQLLPVYFQIHRHTSGFEFLTLIVSHHKWRRNKPWGLKRYEASLLLLLFLQLGTSWHGLNNYKINVWIF